MPKAYIIARRAISYRRYITRSARNGYHCKKPLLSTRQKRFFTWRRRRDLKLLCNPSCGARKNPRALLALFLDFFDRCAHPYSLHRLRRAPRRCPRRNRRSGSNPVFPHKKPKAAALLDDCFLSWRRRRDLKLLRNPSCGARKNPSGASALFLGFFDRCAHPCSLHRLRRAPRRCPRRNRRSGSNPVLPHIKTKSSRHF